MTPSSIKGNFQITGSAPKTAVMLHVNDTYGTSIRRAWAPCSLKFDMPYQILQEIAYDPTARDLSVEVAKAKATGAEAFIAVSRLNDAILVTPRTGQAALDADGGAGHRSGWLRGSVSQDPRQAFGWSDRAWCPGTIPTRSSAKLWKPRSRRRTPAWVCRPTMSIRSRRCWSPQMLTGAPVQTDPKALADAIRTTNITNNVSPGPGIMFDTRRVRTDKLKGSAVQNRGGKLVTLAPKEAANAKPEWPLKPYDKRG